MTAPPSAQPALGASALEHGILVVDFGSQTTLLIARRIRELGVYSEVWACDDPRLAASPACLGVILSGGPASVSHADAPRLAAPLLELGRPVLGICYGMQLLVEHAGGRVEPGTRRQYGRTALRVTRGLVDDGDALATPQSALFDALEPRGAVVWMSHGDSVTVVPSGFAIAARSDDGTIAAIEDPARALYGVQFHPEVSHTEGGTELLRRFVLELCGAPPDAWSLEALAERLVDDIRTAVGDEARVICGLSGGVDSAVTAALVSRAIGRRLVCILVDTGLMRHEEAAEVTALFQGHFDLELRVVDARARFFDALRGLTDPEHKRKAIGRVFVEVFEDEARSVPEARFLAQGTLYPDVIESTTFRGPSSSIKSHHNVGGLPERLPFVLLEPLRLLFKDEVRALGQVLGLPRRLTGRHPFPGPGLAIRVLGEVTPAQVEMARAADRIFIEALHGEGLYDSVWQAFAVLLPVRTVGVMGDARTYEQVVALRAVTSHDGMTADRAALPLDFLGRVAERIVNEVPGVNRVVYDLTSKPPGTIEWE